MDDGTLTSADYVDSLLTKARDLAGKISGLHDQVCALTVTTSSPDRLVTATVGPAGRLLDLTIDPRVYREPNSAVLAATIVSVIERAQAGAAEAEAEIRSRALPDAAELGGAVGVDLGELTGLFAPAPNGKGSRDATA
jgi:DNA-binding protein YbaB